MHQHKSSKTKTAQPEGRWRYITNAFQECMKFYIYMVHGIPPVSLSMSFFRCGFQYCLMQCIRAWDIIALNNVQIRYLKVWCWRMQWQNPFIRNNFILSGPDFRNIIVWFVSVTLVNHSSLAGC